MNKLSGLVLSPIRLVFIKLLQWRAIGLIDFTVLVNGRIVRGTQLELVDLLSKTLISALYISIERIVV